ncbi:MAG: glycosyltransferase family 1 protein, partial [Verrucomicrobiota bacterium]
PDATFPELLAATGGGVLATANTPAALAQALEPLLLDPARLRRLGDAGQAAVRARFTDETMARAVAATTRSVLAGTRATSPARPAGPG